MKMTETTELILLDKNNEIVWSVNFPNDQGFLSTSWTIDDDIAICAQQDLLTISYPTVVTKISYSLGTRVVQICGIENHPMLTTLDLRSFPNILPINEW